MRGLAVMFVVLVLAVRCSPTALRRGATGEEAPDAAAIDARASGRGGAVGGGGAIAADAAAVDAPAVGQDAAAGRDAAPIVDAARADLPTPDAAVADAARDAMPPRPADAAPTVELGRGLVGHWKLDEGQGTTVADASGKGNSGTFAGAPTWTAGGFPAAKFANPGSLKFDGGDDFVELGVAGLPAAQAPQSISVWANWTATPAATANQNFVALTNPAGSRVQIGIRSNKLAAWKRMGMVLVSAPLPAPGWHHVVYTFDGTTHALYVDGAAPATATTAPDSGAV